MDSVVLMEAQIQTKKMYTLLTEVLDLTTQMAQAADRGDQVSFQMLLGLREEPINSLRMVRRALEEQRNSLPKEDGWHLAELLNGAGTEIPEEQSLVAQVSRNLQLWERVMAIDRRVNQKLTGDAGA